MRRLLEQWQRDGRRLVLNCFCLAVVGVALVTGAAGLRGELRASSAMATRIEAIPRDHDQFLVRGFGGSRRGFAHFARQLIPPNEPFRLVQPARDNPHQRRVCQPGVPGGEHFWMVYSLVPRPKTCDPKARWTVYLGIALGRYRRRQGPRLQSPARSRGGRTGRRKVIGSLLSWLVVAAAGHGLLRLLGGAWPIPRLGVLGAASLSILSGLALLGVLTTIIGLLGGPTRPLPLLAPLCS